MPVAAVEAKAEPAMMSRAVASMTEQSPCPGEEAVAAATSSLVSPASDGSSPDGSIARPVYIAPKTNTNSLRGSIVVKADMLKKAHSPSEEEKSNFPSMFLNRLTKGSSGNNNSSSSRCVCVCVFGIWSLCRVFLQFSTAVGLLRRCCVSPSLDGGAHLFGP